MGPRWCRVALGYCSGSNPRLHIPLHGPLWFLWTNRLKSGDAEVELLLWTNRLKSEGPEAELFLRMHRLEREHPEVELFLWINRLESEHPEVELFPAGRFGTTHPVAICLVPYQLHLEDRWREGFLATAAAW